MPSINVRTDGDHEQVGRDVQLDKLPVLHTTAEWTVDAMERGMKSGATSLMVFIPVYLDGVGNCMVAAEISLNLWMQASTILAAKFHDEITKPGWAVLSEEAKDVLRPRFAEALKRVLPDATEEQRLEAVEIMLVGFGADAPPEMFEQP